MGVLDGLGKAKAQGNGNRTSHNTAYKTAQKWNYFKLKHIKKEVPAEQLYGGRSQAYTRETVHLCASLKCLYTNTCSTENKQEKLYKLYAWRFQDSVG